MEFFEHTKAGWFQECLRAGLSEEDVKQSARDFFEVRYDDPYGVDIDFHYAKNGNTKVQTDVVVRNGLDSHIAVLEFRGLTAGGEDRPEIIWEVDWLQETAGGRERQIGPRKTKPFIGQG